LSKKRVILADDMGLGKTHQGIVAMEALRTLLGAVDGIEIVIHSEVRGEITRFQICTNMML
tara:strand:+ start:39 stop:221 length:183 start_codon:yes stop_codon:yes gene_type:complete